MNLINLRKENIKIYEYIFPLLIFILYFSLFLYKKEIWLLKGIDLIDADSRELFFTSKNLYINFDLVKHPLYFIWHIPLLNILDFFGIPYLISLAFIYSLYPSISSLIIIKIFKKFNYFNSISIILLIILFSSYSLFSIFLIPETYSFTFLFACLVVLNLAYIKTNNLQLIFLGFSIALLSLCNLSAFLVFPPVFFSLSYSKNYDSKKLVIFSGSFLITFLLPFIFMILMGSNNLIGATNQYASKYSEASNLISLKEWFNVFIGIFPGSILNSTYDITPKFKLNFLNTFIISLSYLFVFYKNRFSQNLILTNSLKYFLFLYIIFVVYFHPPSIYLYSSLPLLIFFLLLINKINYLVEYTEQKKLNFFILSLILIASFVITTNIYSMKRYLNAIEKLPLKNINSFNPAGNKFELTN